MLDEQPWGEPPPGGLSAEDMRRLVLRYATSVEIAPLTDPTLWGGPISDERYLCVARPH